MTEPTALDLAHIAMAAEPSDDSARLHFYERLADAELHLMLNSEPTGGKLNPAVFPVDRADYVLVFDHEERLAEFAGQITPYAALSGRTIAAMLTGQSIGLGVNLGVAPSSILIPPEAVSWLADTVAVRPAEEQDRPIEVGAPSQVPQSLLQGLNVKLAAAAGLAQSAYLVAVDYQSGRYGHLLGFVQALAGAEQALSQAVAEALVFSGVEGGEIDVAFFAEHDPICAKLANVGLRFDLPQQCEFSAQPAAPGMDPKSPPRLR